MIWSRLLRRELNLDLLGPDDEGLTSTTQNDASTVYAEREAGRFIMSVLYYMLDEGMIAANFFHDRDSMCLRMICYPGGSGASGADAPFQEYFPSVSAMAKPTIEFLRKRAGMDGNRKNGLLRIRFRGRRLDAACESPHPEEIRLFFSDERPTMRTVGLSRPGRVPPDE